MAVPARTKKVEAKSVLELKKNDIKEFVQEILLKDGFPAIDCVRYIYYRNGYLYATEEINKNLHWCFWDDEFVVYIVKNPLEYESTTCFPLEKYGLSWSSPLQNWIETYLNESFKEWVLEDWILKI